MLENQTPYPPLDEPVNTYTARHQVDTVSDSLAGLIDYEWDAQGRLQQKGARAFAWDSRERLLEVTEGGVPVSSYSYDASGLKLRTSDAGGVSQFTWAPAGVHGGAPELLEVRAADNALLSRPIRGAGRSVVARFDGSGILGVIEDRLGTPLQESDASGVTHTQSFDPWGQVQNENGTTSSPLGYTGHERADASGLIYMKARWYDPEAGVFVSEDPRAQVIGRPETAHPYCYAAHNPIAFVDPNGREEACLGSQYDEKQNGSRKFTHFRIEESLPPTQRHARKPSLQCNGLPCEEMDDVFRTIFDACEDKDLGCILKDADVDHETDRAQSSQKKTTLYVNGIQTGLLTHVRTLRGIRDITGGFVLGVFNPSGTGRIGTSEEDNLGLLGLASNIGRSFYRRHKRIIDLAQPDRNLDRTERRVFWALRLLDKKLAGYGSKGGIWAHSEGSVIVSNAGTAYWIQKNRERIEGQYLQHPRGTRRDPVLLINSAPVPIPFFLQTFGAFEFDYTVGVADHAGRFRNASVWMSPIHQINVLPGYNPLDTDFIPFSGGSIMANDGDVILNENPINDPMSRGLISPPHSVFCNIQNAVQQ